MGTMSVAYVEFLMVLPADVGRVGPAGAVILALVRFVTAAEAYGDRLLIDGQVWWRASHAEIGKSLGGVDRYSVQRAIKRLEETGELLSLLPGISGGDQTKAYRLPSDLPMGDFATALTSQCAESQRLPQWTSAETQRTSAESHRYQCENARPTTYREPREVKKAGASAETTGAEAGADSLPVAAQSEDPLDATAPYGRCDTCTCTLEADGTCPRCRLLSGGWKCSGSGDTGQAAAQ
ncbi:hypothetical protein ABGB19_03285 [Mycobacterium sp. B14F4]|uniref:hypothetical protein n=1 Tax=Mycobacterium sp. B14F4 TaxID=3153565 RepID=UPI00325DD02E